MGMLPSKFKKFSGAQELKLKRTVGEILLYCILQKFNFVKKAVAGANTLAGIKKGHPQCWKIHCKVGVGDGIAERLGGTAPPGLLASSISSQRLAPSGSVPR